MNIFIDTIRIITNISYYKCVDAKCPSHVNFKNNEIVKGPNERNHTTSILQIEHGCLEKTKALLS